MGTQCHGRRIRVWRWGQAVDQCVGEEWAKMVQNSAAWRSQLEEMINGKRRKIVDRTCVQIERHRHDLSAHGMCDGGFRLRFSACHDACGKYDWWQMQTELVACECIAGEWWAGAVRYGLRLSPSQWWADAVRSGL